MARARPDILWLTYITLANFLALQGRYEESSELMVQAQDIGAGFGSPVIAAVIGALRAQSNLLAKRFDEAEHWAASLVPFSFGRYVSDLETLTLARLHLVSTRYKDCIAVLEEPLMAAEARGCVALPPARSTHSGPGSAWIALH